MERAICLAALTALLALAPACAFSNPRAPGADRAQALPAARDAPAFSVIDSVLDASLGALTHDGPATPEQISLYLPITGSPGTELVSGVRYSEAGSWAEGHPLFQIRPEFAVNAAKAPRALAGVITGLAPGRTYQIEVVVSAGSGFAVRTLTAKTRALPDPSPAVTKTVTANTTAAQIQTIFDSAAAGDVILFRNGTYQVDKLTLRRSGTESQPIHIRGESRDSVKIVDRAGRVLYLVNASHVVIENLTLEGSGVDSGTAATSEGIRAWNGYTPKRITVRNLRITGVDKGIVGEGDMEQFLVYDNTLVGNDVFEKSTLESNASWNDDGIRVPGRGHAVFNNTLSGFGDALAMSAGTQNVGVHFYRNRILFTCDDAFEGDYGTRNVTFYDNRIQNSMTLASFDPIYSGPAFVFRNVAINTGRAPYKLNEKGTGLFFYNNTVVRIPGHGSGATWGWIQFNNGSLRAWGYRNNILIFGGTSLVGIESTGNDPIDFSHNAWYPDGRVWWSTSGGSYASLSAARSRLPATLPLFGVVRHRHGHDRIAESNPFEVSIPFNATYDVPVTTLYEPKLSDASKLKGAGVVIPGITDGFAGTNPDVGAVIAGRSGPRVGDRTR